MTGEQLQLDFESAEVSPQWVRRVSSPPVRPESYRKQMDIFLPHSHAIGAVAGHSVESQTKHLPVFLGCILMANGDLLAPLNIRAVAASTQLPECRVYESFQFLMTGGLIASEFPLGRFDTLFF